ncbi:MAG: DUF4105 domain-containing protein [Bacteroidota bacterium]
MKNKLLIFLLLLELTAFGSSQQVSEKARFSMLTCSPGKELYSAFGHSAIRFSDSLNGEWVDVVFNYGTFEFSDDFYVKFAQGRLNYMLDIQEFSTFYRQYILSGRGILENELLLYAEEKQHLFDLLMENAKDENKYFRYDFFYDNCSTRIRDILVKAFPEIQLPTTQIVRPTFRKTIDLYLTKLGWADFGIDLVLGLPCDRLPSDRDIEFLPDSLYKSARQWKYNGRKLLGPTDELLPFDESQMNMNENGEIIRIKNYENPAKKWMWIVGLLFGLFSLYQLVMLRKRVGFLVIDRIFLFILGFIELALLCMWFLTDHNATKWNLNVLWASPLLLVLAFHSLQKSKPWFSILLMVQLALVILVALGTLFPTLSPQFFNSSILPLALAEMVVLIRIILIRKKIGIHHYI